ncbi:MAG: hypothetical protein H6702_19600 [Myxococcales bacterium]|nr:hypothetical protein [Myxococcales bacterium]
MRTLDVPQANDLATVRAVVYAVRKGNLSREELAEFTGFSKRHVRYRVHAARVLGLIDLEADLASITPLGERLLAARVKSDEARQVWKDAIERSPTLQVLAPDLLADQGPDAETLTERICEATGASPSTARRRASGLLRWRYTVLGIEPASERPGLEPPPVPEPAPEAPPAPEPKPAPKAEAAAPTEQLSLFG